MKTTTLLTLLAPTLIAAAPNPDFPSITGNWGGPWATSAIPSSALSAFNAYTSAHPSGWSSSDWSSFTSAYPLPSGYGGYGPGGFGGSFGGGGFSGSPGSGPFGSGPGGWKGGPGGMGPFGGDGFGPFGNGSWTAGPWTSWWGGDKCPPSTWPGWTSGSWSSSCPWTTWSACTATPTATSVYTTTISGSQVVETSFGYKVAQAVSTGSGAVTTSVSTGGALSGREVTNGVVGVAAVAAVVGVLVL